MIRLITVALGASLLAPLVAWGLNDGYHGTTDAGGLIAVRVDYDRKEQPTRVHSLRWANIPVSSRPCEMLPVGWAPAPAAPATSRAPIIRW